MTGVEWLSIAIPALLVVGVVESLMSGCWVAFYFRHGIAVFKREFCAESNLEIDVEKLENAFRRSRTLPLVFKRIGENECAFRERLFMLKMFSYTPIMHGHLLVRGNAVTVTGRLNWCSAVFCVVWIVGVLQFGAETASDIPTR